MNLLLLASALLLSSGSSDLGAPDDLDAVVAQLRRDIQNHQWLRILDRSDPQYREAQTLQTRRAHAEYIQQLLGMERGSAVEGDDVTGHAGVRLRDLRFRDLFPSKVDESIPPSARPNRRQTTEADLDQIRRVT